MPFLVCLLQLISGATSLFLSGCNFLERARLLFNVVTFWRKDGVLESTFYILVLTPLDKGTSLT